MERINIFIVRLKVRNILRIIQVLLLPLQNNEYILSKAELKRIF